MSSDVLLVPIQLQAFVLNPAVCNTGKDDDNGARIVPITQPNYTFLRLDNYLIQSDILNHADLHNAAPAELNLRMTDLGTRPMPTPRRNRHGVYLHWILPQMYRSGIAAADSVSWDRHEADRIKRGLPPRTKPSPSAAKDSPTMPTTSTPELLQPPTRWIIVRKLDLNSISPSSAASTFNEYQAWVIESDYQWALDDIPLDYDLQVDISPFVVGVVGEDINIEQQAEVFIGRKTPLEKWTHQADAKRANINLLRSSNQLFADYQLHNSNVFSMLDNFEYPDPQDKKKSLYLDKASASYYLIGWHEDNASDPLWDNSGEITHDTKLQALFMSIKAGADSDEIKTWLAATDPARLCIHGAMYDVNWDHSSKPQHVPADDYSALLKRKDLPAVSVGTSPMDSLITYCTARKAQDESTISKLEEDILAIDSLLHARDDGVEGQREAKDTVYNWNFSRYQGGIHHFLGGEDNQGRPTQPNPDGVTDLKELNQVQILLDSCVRSARQYRWNIFSSWWKYVSDVTNREDESNNRAVKKVVEDLAKRLDKLDEHAQDLASQIETIKARPSLKNAKAGTLPFYYRVRDPTVLVGGIESGWPVDYNDNVLVRLPSQTVKGSVQIPAAVKTMASAISQAFSGPLSEADALLTEFYALLPQNGITDDAGSGQVVPQFHDHPETLNGEQRWRDRWENRQPFFPLYAEWEVEYTHVPFELWSLDEQAARYSDSKLIRYGIPKKDNKPLWEILQTGDPDVPHDVRILSGRTLILPQPSFSLAAKVTQLFADTPPTILEEYLKAEKRKELSDGIHKLSYLSCPLSGLTEGLLTLSQGTHIKPENKDVGNDGVEFMEAIAAAEFRDAGLNKVNIERILGNSGFTPYGSMMNFGTDEFCPFKPATHGQFRFRKLNIIDKFGQALTAIDAQPRPNGHPPLFPCISDFYEPQLIELTDGTKTANTIIQNSEQNCEFIQLPPTINQNSRLNSCFVISTIADKIKAGQPIVKTDYEETESYWRPSTEWENPIWGWVVVNYADQGLQLFLKDGTFYSEIRFGGPNEADTSPKWLPFAPDKLPADVDTAQLDSLIDKLGKKDYLQDFWNMVVTALENLPAAPSAYAQFLSAIVGKPLALVNMGWSLELDGPPLSNQTTNAKKTEPNKHLLRVDEEDTACYSFRIKLGDKLREYDGLVGYFDSNPKPDPEAGGKDALNLEYINTYFGYPKDADAQKTTKLKLLTKDTYPEFEPFWIPPFPEKEPYDKPISVSLYDNLRNRKMQVYGAILDPFTPVHAYSSILPAEGLQLPPWTWQDAMTTMTAFFHAGPLHVTQDVKTYNKDQKLTTSNMKAKPLNNVQLPALGVGDWSWLQPYEDPDPLAELPVYNAYGLESKGNIASPGFQKGPYTALEGYLQLRRPIMSPDPKADQPVVEA